MVFTTTKRSFVEENSYEIGFFTLSAIEKKLNDSLSKPKPDTT
jgi:hypothetical protein